MTKNLSRASFQQSPVWKWDESQEGHEPVVDWRPLKKDEPVLFIKADFIAADGSKFEGYLVGLESFYAVGLFVENNEHVLNLNLPDMIDSSIKLIREQLGRAQLNLFPLKYKTEVSFDDDKKLTGVLTL